MPADVPVPRKRKRTVNISGSRPACARGRGGSRVCVRGRGRRAERGSRGARSTVAIRCVGGGGGGSREGVSVSTIARRDSGMGREDPRHAGETRRGAGPDELHILP